MSERVPGILGYSLPGEVSMLPRNRKHRKANHALRMEPGIRKIEEEGGKSYQRNSLDNFIFTTTRYDFRWLETSSKLVDMLKAFFFF